MLTVFLFFGCVVFAKLTVHQIDILRLGAFKTPKFSVFQNTGSPVTAPAGSDQFSSGVAVAGYDGSARIALFMDFR